jgi:DNA repair exonuclease SbcCD nuclease subunit
MNVPDIDDMTSIFVIGDPHFRAKNFQEGEELIEKCIKTASELTPTAIVILGDILDTHEVVRNTPWKQACKFIEDLSDIAHTYVLMGNHDYINQSQFLTDNHFFNPLKKWNNVTIVDYPILQKIGNGRPCKIVLCPYTPPGRFVEALDHVNKWKTAQCIFAHQEFEGVFYGGKESSKGDSWNEEYPPVISGHIHTPCQIGTNIFYPGSSIQVASDEQPDKRVWNITFDSEEEGVDALQIDKIDLGLKGKKEVEMNYSDIKTFDFGLLSKYYIKIKLRGTSEQFKMFRKSPLHAKMAKTGIKFSFDPIPDERALDIKLNNVDDLSFENILKLLVDKKSEAIQSAYEELHQVEIVYE